MYHTNETLYDEALFGHLPGEDMIRALIEEEAGTPPADHGGPHRTHAPGEQSAPADCTDPDDPLWDSALYEDPAEVPLGDVMEEIEAKLGEQDPPRGGGVPAGREHPEPAKEPLEEPDESCESGFEGPKESCESVSEDPDESGFETADESLEGDSASLDSILRDLGW